VAEKLKLKTIKEIIFEDEEKKVRNFYIPSYQRGYRWGKTQVEKLLDDILEFSFNKTNDEFYPLQPIVVFKDNDKYELIDGQQRVTTIYIILKYLQNIFIKIEDKQKELNSLKDIIGSCFGKMDSLKEKISELRDIIYDTRKGSEDFLKKISEDIDNKNPDFYYMSNAYKTIKEWFIEKNINYELFLDTLLNDTKVIWYEIDPKDDKEKRDIFARLNIGKIELTNAELIRALLLNDIKDYKQQIEIGYELDKIEYSLRDEIFWYFLEEKDRDTKIDLIYELLADTYKKELHKEEQKKFNKKLDEKYSFYLFEYVLNNKIKTKEVILEEIKQYYRFLEEWFLDEGFYHKIGYLLTIQNKIKLLDFITKYKKFNKQYFRKYLDDIIKEELKDIDIDDLKYGKDSSEIRKILLLFNIQTILDNENITYKFDFKKFKNRKNDDDIEHIRSQTDPDITGKRRDEWIETIFKVFGKKEDKISEALNRYKDDNKFKKFHNRLSKRLGESKIFDEDLKDSIGNLTLLDSRVNRSYGNSFFPIKRAIILNEDRRGTFIPLCTKNVFLKTYSSRISNPMDWDENDIKSHKEIIKKTIKQYLGANNE